MHTKDQRTVLFLLKVLNYGFIKPFPFRSNAGKQRKHCYFNYTTFHFSQVPDAAVDNISHDSFISVDCTDQQSFEKQHCQNTQ